MEEFRISNAIVRVHNIPDQERIVTATANFLKRVKENEKKKKAKQHLESD